jgi:5-formyltetrahydrofolate cyclo-ligase
MMQKDDLRIQMRAKLAGLTAAEVRARSAAIWERLSVLPAFAGAPRALIYVSRDNEVDTRGLIQQLLALGRRVCVPWFDPRRQRYIVSELHDFAADLAPGKFGILEPKSDAVRPVIGNQINAALVPGLAFDTTGNRLGHGMGYFDALLQDVPGAKIALAYDFQVVSDVPAESHDVRMDFIVTETRNMQIKGNVP